MPIRLRSLLSLAVFLLLSACATLLGPRQMEIPLAQLQQAISTRFPFNNRFLELLDIRVSNPQVALQPEANRILTSMDAAIAPPFLHRVWQGKMAISGNLKFDPTRNALLLGDPRVERFTLDGFDSPYANKILQAAGLLAEQLLQDAVLYTFSPDELRYGGTRFILSKITTRADGLVVTFEPVR